MNFETIEQAVAYVEELQKKYDDLQTAHEGLQGKLSEVNQYTEQLQSEISRLKIKNYEYLEQITTSLPTPQPKPTEPEEGITLNDILKDVK